MKLVWAAIAAIAIAMGAGSASAQPADPENTLYIELFCGRVVIQLRPDLAPLHVRLDDGRLTAVFGAHESISAATRECPDDERQG